MNKTTIKTKAPAWSDVTFVKPGDRVKLVDRKSNRKDGERYMSTGTEPNILWIHVGATGVVREVKSGYPPHSCRDHHLSPECTCGEVGPAGTLPELPAWAIVEWETDQPGKTSTTHVLKRETEGVNWERIK